MSEKNTENLVSVATVIHNDFHIIDSFVEETIGVLEKSFTNYELLLIDNGSTDSTVSKIKELLSKVANIRLIVLSRCYHEEVAYTTALEHCIGDFVVLMDVNFDPPSLIPEIIEKCITGHDIVVAEKSDVEKETFFKKVSSQLFYKMSSFLTDYNVHPKLGNFFAFSRKSVNSIITIKDKIRYLKYLIYEIGYDHYKITYRLMNRSGIKPKRNFFKSFIFAVEIVVSNSNRLIRMCSLIGLLAGLLNLLYIIYTLVFYAVNTVLLGKEIVAGWTTSAVISSVMFFLLFFILAIISEYLTRILRETKTGSLYYIKEEHSSCVFPKNINKINVI